MNLKELKYVLYGEDRLSGKLSRVTRASDKTNRALNKTSKRLSMTKQRIRGMAGEVPGLAVALRMASNPIALAGAGIIALGAGLNRAKNEAAQFKSTFRELENLNLDKSTEQINKLKRSVLGLSFRKGFDPLLSSTGYYDVQSVTGKFGSDVSSIVSKQGEFAKVMNADFNQWISGTAKAMKNYGFGFYSLDKFNASAYKTVQTGVTTYNQLSKVMAEYMGTAAAAGQTFDAANKIFAVFTASSKNVDIAATKVKSLFEAIHEERTRNAFKEILGIDLFENGKAKQVDKVLRELNSKLKVMSNLDFAKFKSAVGGNEGIKELLNAATDASGDLIRTLDTFDSSKFNFSEAKKKAEEDLNYVNSLINSKLKTSFIQLGDTILPVWVDIKNTIVDTIDTISSKLYNFAKSYYRVIDMDKYRQLVSNRAQLKIEEGYLVAKDEYADMVRGAKATSQNKMTGITSQLQQETKTPRIRDYTSGVSDEDWANLETGRKKYLRSVVSKLEKIQSGSTTFAEAFGGLPSGNLGSGAGLDKDPYVANGLESISGGGKQVRNVTVNITSLIGNQELNNVFDRNGNANSDDIQKEIMEQIVRAVRGAEQVLTYNN